MYLLYKLEDQGRLYCNLSIYDKKKGEGIGNIKGQLVISPVMYDELGIEFTTKIDEKILKSS